MTTQAIDRDEMEWQAIEAACRPYVSSVRCATYLVPADCLLGPRQQAHKPHPDSYRPDLPLRGSAGLTTATRQDRAIWDARPLDLFSFPASEEEAGERGADSATRPLFSSKRSQADYAARQESARKSARKRYREVSVLLGRYNIRPHRLSRLRTELDAQLTALDRA